ncbi:hypothetical protein LL999_23160 [Burkholderia ambifaria]|uniref:hypothetical protein n=1 Tax=Burkholderia ambifaria TaxID=152480 RepID=UPI001E50F18D|nr:hypothetical protein [Burkholderia ambifaria]UEP23146.1 hypothetical protein LL999_23160 [Burkholderia ambifaria]
MNKTLTSEMIAALKQAALAATPQNIDSAQSIDHYNDGRYIECPCCSGEGSVELEADFLNYDGMALGVQFYGIGNAPGAAEAYFRAASPASILALLDRLERAEAAILATQQPKPRDDVTDDQIADMFERVTGYSLENGRAALNDADILGFARELLEAARAGEAS